MISLDMDWDNLRRLAESDHPPDRAFAISSSHTALESLLKRHGYQRVLGEISFHELCFQTARLNRIRLPDKLWIRLSAAIRARNALAHDGSLPDPEPAVAAVDAYAEVYEGLELKIKPREKIEAAVAARRRLMQEYASEEPEDDDEPSGTAPASDDEPLPDADFDEPDAPVPVALPEGSSPGPGRGRAGALAPEDPDAASSPAPSPRRKSKVSSQRPAAGAADASSPPRSESSEATHVPLTGRVYRYPAYLFAILAVTVTIGYAWAILRWAAPASLPAQLGWTALALAGGAVGAVLSVAVGWVLLVGAVVGGVGALVGVTVGGVLGALVGGLLDGHSGALVGARWGGGILAISGAVMTLWRHYASALTLTMGGQAEGLEPPDQR